MQRRTEVALLCAAITLATIAVLASQPRDVFWGPDSGNRFIQLQALLRTGRLAIVDAPHAGHHFVRRGQHVYSFYSPTFAIASLPFYALVGTCGLFVLPLLGTLAIALLLSPLLERDYLPMAAIAIFATPLFWYTVVFWEHTLAVALSLAAYVLVTRNRPLAAGVVAAAGTCFREEGYVVMAAIALAMLFTRRRGVIHFSAGALMILVPLWAANTALYEHPLGLHARIYSGMAGPRLSNWYVYLFEFTRWPKQLRDTLYTQGFFPGVPIACTALFTRTRDRFLLTTIAIGIVLTPLLLNQADFGIIWGPRHFLWLIPLVAAAAGPALRQSRLSCAATLLLATFGLVLQLSGLHLLREKLLFSERVLQLAEASGKPIVTDVFWIPEDLASLYGRRKVTLVGRDDQFPSTPLLFIAARGNRVISGRALTERVIRRAHVARDGDPMLDAMLLDCR